MIAKFLKSVVLFVVVAGVLVALLKAFNWDPFSLLSWIVNGFWSLINAISNFFVSNDTFQSMTKHR